MPKPSDHELALLIPDWLAEAKGRSASSFRRWLKRRHDLNIGSAQAERVLRSGATLKPTKMRKWEALGKDGEIVELHHITYDVQSDWRNAVRAFIEEEVPTAPEVATAPAGPRLGVLSIADPHIGKLAWEPEVDQAYDTKRAVGAYLQAAERLIQALLDNGVGHVLYIVGNDLLHVDGFSNATTKGTPQDTDTRWQYAFRRAKNAVVGTIEMMRSFATVDVVVAPGNHDRVLSWTLGEVLGAFYREATNVSIDNAPRYRKYRQYEKLLFGITHGDGIKPLALPAIMATEMPTAWGATTWREWLLGHVHRRREFVSVGIEEERGVRMTYLPSLSAQDRWHYEMGYENTRAAEARVYDPLRGVLVSSHYYFL